MIQLCAILKTTVFCRGCDRDKNGSHQLTELPTLSCCDSKVSYSGGNNSGDCVVSVDNDTYFGGDDDCGMLSGDFSYDCSKS